ncbi:Rv2231c family pyridoxal phosphate-dependent protein CobC [Lentzea sp. BCCO 10_0061]|uniref:Aminotransferase n=1 Tax=Lentzea sokolovensis TaxID=3095429 RepID=A0ABU4V8K2_9PSEU|nr:Rv2231c family pyridoxal phosphate-dependent protein CobC [Lentzea sp. BCCO 10_0061]MDX8148074.1 Rv2231c family pyridoxal phosphate-dependent protein CobC [Lentzea sp. BCCO 10_0061]
MTSSDLRHHGDVDAAPGLADFAVNVRVPHPPDWLRERLAAALDGLGRYPSKPAEERAREAVARRHGRSPDEVLLLNGAAEGFALLPKLAPRRAAIVHPGFTEPEVAFRDAGIPVEHVLLDGDFQLRDVRSDADLTVIGNPTNPTSVLHEAARLKALPGRLVVDEAFMDAVPGEPESLAHDPDVLVLRSLTKTWGLAGLRAGYFLGDPETLARLAHGRPHWPVGSLTLEAITACCEPEALEQSSGFAKEAERHAAYALEQLQDLVVVAPKGPFLLIRAPRGTRQALRDKGIAVRRCDTFPGLDDTYLRVAIRPPEEFAVFVDALRVVMEEQA